MLPLVLASQSPRRRQMLAALGVVFKPSSANVDESQRPNEPPQALVQRLAQEKALAVARRFPGHPVLGADTIVVLDGLVLGKPADANEATAMLRSLRERSHEVLSAVFALDPASGRQATALSRSVVWMRGYSDDEIAAYVASGDPMDKAGAYAIQNRAFAPVAHMEGCFSGVMGFPLGHVAQVLAAIGLPPAQEVEIACQPFSGRCCQS